MHNEVMTGSLMRLRSVGPWLAITAALWMGTAQALGEPVVLVEDSEPRAGIVIPEEPSEQVSLAAEELRDHIEAMSTARLPITHEQPTEGATIVLGGAAPDGFLAELSGETDIGGSFRIEVEEDRITIAGLEDAGTLYGAYELLETLGVRWFIPGEIGRLVPEQATVQVSSQDRLEIPAFAGRRLQAIGDVGHTAGSEWGRRMRSGGFSAGSHGLVMSESADRETEPEMFMKEDGRRTGKVRINHPETIRRTIEGVRQRLDEGRENAAHEGVRYISMGPADGLGFGEDPWDAGEVDPLHGRVSVTDRYVRFFNEVLEAVEADHEDVGIAFYAYSQHMRAPVREQPHEHILPVLAPIDVCRFHAIDNPLCWERQYIKNVVEGWREAGTRMTYRGYLFNLADPSLPFSMIRQVAAELPYYHEAGLFAVQKETKPAWGYQGPSLYLTARMMWDVDVDVEAVLGEFFEGMYGPAAEPMRAHFEILEDAFEVADYHTGNVYDFPHILTPEVLAEMEATLAEAEQRVADYPDERDRVAMVRVAFDYGTTFLAMVEAIQDFDFVEAEAKLARLHEELIPAAVEHDPPILSLRYVPAFVDRFWQDMVEEGHARVTEGNRIIKELPEQWRVMLDPHDGGEALGLWKPKIGAQSWKPLNTYSTTWSNQGLRYYKGPHAIIWYRTTVEIPADVDPGDHIFLWLGSVDNEAEAWINGHKLERLRRGSAPTGRPWEFAATDVLEPGEPNVIVVKVANDVHRELGTGGLTGPAMLWRAETAASDLTDREDAVDPLEMLPGQ